MYSKGDATLLFLLLLLFVSIKTVLLITTQTNQYSFNHFIISALRVLLLHSSVENDNCTHRLNITYESLT